MTFHDQDGRLPEVFHALPPSVHQRRRSRPEPSTGEGVRNYLDSAYYPRIAKPPFVSATVLRARSRTIYHERSCANGLRLSARPYRRLSEYFKPTPDGVRTHRYAVVAGERARCTGTVTPPVGAGRQEVLPQTGSCEAGGPVIVRTPLLRRRAYRHGCQRVWCSTVGCPAAARPCQETPKLLASAGENSRLRPPWCRRTFSVLTGLDDGPYETSRPSVHGEPLLV